MEEMITIEGLTKRFGLFTAVDNISVAIGSGEVLGFLGPNGAGKSTLLNTLLNEERAIVTEVAGTTRDAIEDEISLGGIKFRFIDTAGIRETEDVVESIGIRKTFEKIEQSQVVLYLFNVESLVTLSGVEGQDFSEVIKNEINQLKAKTQGKTLLIVANKMDLVDIHSVESSLANLDADLLRISALEKTGIEELIQCLTAEVNLEALNSNQTIVTNARHYDALNKAFSDIQKVEEGLENQISGDFLAMDIREALKHLGSIIGEVETDRDILGNIFGKFCIGK